MQRKFARAAASIAAMLVLFASTARVAAADLAVFTSAAPAEVEKAIAAKFSETTGHRARFTTGTVRDVQEKLTRASAIDVVVLPAPAVETLDKAGLLRPRSTTVLARVGIGVAVRDGTALPDVSTPDAVRRMVLNARSIAYPDPLGGGFAGAQIARILERLGVADAAKPKTILKYGYEGGVAAVAGGEVEIGFFNISEILPVKGVKLVGPLPPSLQSYITFSAALHARSRSPEPAMEFLGFLSDARFREFWTMGGFETAAR